MSKKTKVPPEHEEWVYNPVKETVGGKEAEKVIWTTKSLNMAVDALAQGLPLKANPFCGKNTKLIRPDLVFKRTEEEMQDYIKCMQDPVYFGEKCHLMTPEGLQKCELRRYQKEYLYQLRDNRFNIMVSCRQAGKCNCLTTNQLYKIPKNTFYSPQFDKLREKYCFYIKDNFVYIELPMFELYNINCQKEWHWKIKYQLYKIIYKLKKYEKKNSRK